MRVLKALGKTILTIIGAIIAAVGFIALLVFIVKMLYEYWAFIVVFGGFGMLFIGLFLYYYERTDP